MHTSHLTGYGKKLWAIHKQAGGSWSDFTNWVKGAANTVADAGKTVYERAIKPAHQWIKDNKIISKFGNQIDKSGTLSKLAGVAGYGKKKQKGCGHKTVVFG